MRVVCSHHAEALSAVVRTRDENAAARRRAAACGVPRRIDAIAIRRRGIPIDRDHRLVVEVVGAAGKREVGHLRPGAARVGRASDGHRRAVYARAVSEEDDDIAVEEIAARVPGKRRIGTEVDAV